MLLILVCLNFQQCGNSSDILVVSLVFYLSSFKVNYRQGFVQGRRDVLSTEHNGVTFSYSIGSDNERGENINSSLFKIKCIHQQTRLHSLYLSGDCGRTKLSFYRGKSIFELNCIIKMSRWCLNGIQKRPITMKLYFDDSIFERMTSAALGRCRMNFVLSEFKVFFIKRWETLVLRKLIIL